MALRLAAFASKTGECFGLTSTIAILAFALVGTAAATDLTVPAEIGALPQAPSASDNTLKLDLTAAYELALSRNLDLQVGRYDLALANEGILGRSGIFDPNLTFGISGNGSETPVVSILDGAEEAVTSQTTNFSLGINQLLPTGGQLSATTGVRRQATNSSNSFFNPWWATDLSASFWQPLLDGFGTTVNRSAIVIAKNTRDQTAVGFEMQVISTLLEVERAYWNFIAAGEAVAVNQKSLDLATRLLGETRERVNVGTSAPIDLVQSEAGVATRLQSLIASRIAADNAEDALKAMLGFDEPAEWMTRIVATESIETAFLDIDLTEAITVALEQRPIMRQKKIGLENSDLNVKLARNATLPDLDFEASYGYSGIGGTSYFQHPDTGEIFKIDGGFSDSVQQLGDFPHWTLGVQLAMPLGNTGAKATLAQRRYERQRAELDLTAQKQRIILEVRTAVRALTDGVAAIEAAIKSREFAERNLEAEETKFDNGLSTNYQVLEIQEDLAQTQLSEINARTLYRKAIVGYLGATGTLLDRLKVEIVDPGAPEAAHTMWKDIKWMQFVDFGRTEE